MAIKSPNNTYFRRLIRYFLGEVWESETRGYGDTINMTRVKEGLRLFAKGPAFPSCAFFYTYRPFKNGHTQIQVLIVRKKAATLLGRLLNKVLLEIWDLVFRTLREEDSPVFKNLRFSASNLIHADEPLRRFMAHVHRLAPSLWSEPKEYRRIVEERSES